MATTFGGTTLIINELLVAHLKFLKRPGIYMSIAALVCLLTVIYVQFGFSGAKILAKQRAFA